MKAKPAYRQLKIEEKEIIDALLHEDFLGRDEIRKQLETSLVRSTQCSCGCLSVEFQTKSNITVPAKERVPVDASYYRGKNPYQILLHIIDGKVSELEFVSYSDEIDTKYPAPHELKITVNEKV